MNAHTTPRLESMEPRLLLDGFDPLTELTPVGAHPGGVSYYGDMVFGDGLAIESKNWRDAGALDTIPRMLDEDTWNPQFDAAGNPLYLEPGQTLEAWIWNNSNAWHQPVTEPNTMLLDGHHIAEGRMTLQWQGTADIRIVTADYQISGSAAGLETDGTRVYRTGGHKHHKIRILDIDPADPPHDIHAWLPDPDDWEGASLVGETFHPVFLDRLSDADWSYIRFMDFNHTNNSPEKDWSDRRLPGDTFQTGPIHPRSSVDEYWHEGFYDGPERIGVAFEHMVALCNATGKDMWINVPHLASDAYLANLADLLAFGSDGVNPYDAPRADPAYAPLRADLKCYVELSNEIWNPLFGQWHWSHAKAGEQGISVAQNNARLASRAWQAVEAALGAERTVRTAAVWTAQTSYTSTFLGEFYANPALLQPEVMAVTTYFGNGIQNWIDAQDFVPTGATPWDDPYWQSAQFLADQDTAFDQWFHMYFEGIKAGGDTGPDSLAGRGIPDDMRTLSLQYGLPMIAYEGGPSIYTDHLDGPAPEDDGITLFLKQMNRHPRFAEIYDLHLNMVKADGVWTHMPFVLSGNWGKWGQWGHLHWLMQDPADSPKWQEILHHFDEFAAIRHIDHPLGAVPQFTTDAALPWGVVGLPYSRTIEFDPGDGATDVSVIGASLADGLRFDAETLTLSGRPTEAKTSHVYLRLVDADGDPAWRQFTARIAPAEIGYPLLEWEFDSPAGGEYPSGDATANHANVLPASITPGPGVTVTTNRYYNEDAFAVTAADSAALDGDDYLRWTVAPADTVAASLLQARFGVFGAERGVEFQAALRVSDDGFATWREVPLSPPGPYVGDGLGQTAGTEVTADLAAVDVLRDLTGPVEMRLYLWGNGRYTATGIGKLGETDVDLVISGHARSGDLTGDGAIDAADLAAMHAAVRAAATDPAYDLTADGAVDADDVAYLLTVHLETDFGDANLDGRVSDADYTIWADHYGLPAATFTQGDFNGDGAVTDADYTIWADHYGSGM